jgi:hypothetical protein
MKLTGKLKIEPFMGEKRLILDGPYEQICVINMQDRLDLLGSMIRVEGDRVGEGWLVKVTQIKMADSKGRSFGDWTPV